MMKREHVKPDLAKPTSAENVNPGFDEVAHSNTEYVAIFEGMLERATAAVGSEYFQLPIDGLEDPIYRERVYCYELYHQLRRVLPPTFPFSLGGEVDKSGHPFFRKEPLLRAKPDLLVHKPGDMDGNLVVIEVKPVSADSPGVKKDLKMLTAFRRSAKYHSAVYLVYGSNEEAFKDLKSSAEEIAKGSRLIDLELITLYHHKQCHVPATKLDWLSGSPPAQAL